MYTLDSLKQDHSAICPYQIGEPAAASRKAARRLHGIRTAGSMVGPVPDSAPAHFRSPLCSTVQVCLSLLGTWTGPSWNPQLSTLLQVGGAAGCGVADNPTGCIYVAIKADVPHEVGSTLMNVGVQERLMPRRPHGPLCCCLKGRKSVPTA